MHKTRSLLATVLFAGNSTAATILPLNADDANSDASAFNGSLAKTLDDGFAYDPNAPITTLPQQSFNPGAAGFHGSGGNGVAKNLSYTLSASFTTSVAEPVIVIDLYGRALADCCPERDNNINVILYNGDYSTVVETITGLSIDNSVATGAHVRASFDSLPVGTTIDRFRIEGNDSDTNGANNYFTLMETRAAAISAVPEPTSLSLLGFLAIPLLRRRR